MTITNEIQVVQAVEIPLTQGYSVLIDETDAPLVSDSKWCATVRKRTAQPPLVYALRRVPNGGGRVELMHRFLTGAPSEMKVDHWNGDGLDNRRLNLRVASNAQNAWNQGKRPGSSKYKGVHYCKDRPNTPWAAVITVYGKGIYLGRFLSEEAAGAAYNLAAQKHFGDFSRLNLIENAPFNLSDADMKIEWEAAENAQ